VGVLVDSVKAHSSELVLAQVAQVAPVARVAAAAAFAHSRRKQAGCSPSEMFHQVELKDPPKDIAEKV